MRTWLFNNLRDAVLRSRAQAHWHPIHRLIVILFLSKRSIIFMTLPATESAMPFDNPHQTPFGDAELLWDARSRISTRNDWVQGSYKDGNRLCIVGALSLVSGSRSFNTPNRVERRIARVLVAQLPPRGPVRVGLRFFSARQRLMWFNDSPRTGHADVLALFDRAIDHSLSKTPAFISV